MEYKYFISYFGTTNNNNFGFGRTEVTFKKKIESVDDIELIEKELTKMNEYKMTAIINYQLLNKTKNEAE